MADYTITATEVAAFIATPAEITAAYIAVIDEVDPCLEGARVEEERGKTLKRLAVAHMIFLTQNSGRGAVTSEAAPSGASRGFAAWSGRGISGSPFGSMIDGLDASGCITGIFGNIGSERVGMFLGAVGPGRAR